MRKGQFFMVGSLLVAGIIFGVVGLRGSAFITGDSEANTRSFFVRGVEEFSRAVDNSLKEQDDVDNVRKDVASYMDLIGRSNTRRGVPGRYMFIVGVKDSDGYDVVFGNYMESEVGEVNITLDGESNVLDNPRRGTHVLSFNPSGKVFKASMESEGIQKSVNVYDRSFYTVYGVAENDGGRWRKDVSSD